MGVTELSKAWAIDRGALSGIPPERAPLDDFGSVEKMMRDFCLVVAALVFVSNPDDASGQAAGVSDPFRTPGDTTYCVVRPVTEVDTLPPAAVSLMWSDGTTVFDHREIHAVFDSSGTPIRMIILANFLGADELPAVEMVAVDFGTDSGATGVRGRKNRIGEVPPQSGRETMPALEPLAADAIADARAWAALLWASPCRRRQFN